MVIAGQAEIVAMASFLWYPVILLNFSQFLHHIFCCCLSSFRQNHCKIIYQNHRPNNTPSSFKRCTGTATRNFILCYVNSSCRKLRRFNKYKHGFTQFIQLSNISLSSSTARASQLCVRAVQHYHWHCDVNLWECAMVCSIAGLSRILPKSATSCKCSSWGIQTTHHHWRISLCGYGDVRDVFCITHGAAL